MIDISTSAYEHLWGNWAIGLLSISTYIWRHFYDSFVTRGAAILYYDWLLCLGDEIELVWLRGKRLSAASILYFLTRYLALLSHVPTSVALFATGLPLQTCKTLPSS